MQPRDQPPIHSICPDTSPFLELSKQPEKSLLLFTDIKNALVWCYVVQKLVGGSLQHSLGGVQPRDHPPPSTQYAQTPHLFQNCRTSQENHFLFLTDIKNALGLVPCGPKVGRR